MYKSFLVIMQGFTSVEPESLLIKNAHIVDAEGERDGDILIEEGLIKEVGKGLNGRKVSKVLSAKSLVVIPGIIDIHFHIREGGAPYEEDFSSGSKAAAHGGITSALIMPNTNPPIDSPEIVSAIRERASTKSCIRIFITGAATRGREGKVITEYGLMKKEGIVAVSDDGNTIKSTFTMRKCLEYAKTFDLVVIEHAEDNELSGDADEGILTIKYGLKPYPKEAEEIIVGRDVTIFKITGGKLHFAHISSADSLEIIKFSKEKIKNLIDDNNNNRITCDVTTHHLLISTDIVDIKNTNFKVNPPIRSEENRQRLLEFLSDGLIDTISSDHAPHPDFKKFTDFSSAPAGISSADIFFQLCYKLVVDGIISLRKLTELISYNPARILGLKAGLIKEGFPGDILIFSPDEVIEVQENTLFSKGKNCCYIEMKLKGKVEATIVNGKVVYSAESIE